MVALVKIDVTEVWARLQVSDLSPTAFFAACVGRAVAQHPEVHAYRDWLGRLVLHRHVDITTMIEVETSTGSYPLAVPLVDTDTRSVGDLTTEIRQAKNRPRQSRSGSLLLRWGRVAGKVPGLARLVYAVGRRSAFFRSGIGTVALSSVGMMTGGGGFVIGVPTVATLTVLVGGATEQPWVVDGAVTVRRIVDLVVMVDHHVVDGAPAARFGATLRSLLENPDSIEW